ncbi:MAG TPA: hypothetical protein VNW97_23925 [Candidatus Saccharimonadales bacterium]|jgi:hypothetical protein|nr:hypothetical protein [Candidatus Saccharimonadales bacterium]
MKHWSSDVCRWISKLMVAILGLALAGSLAVASDGGGGGGGGTTAPFPGLSLKIQNATVPPNGVYQLQLAITEPKPVGTGSSSLVLSSTVFATGAGASVYDPSGQSSGVLVRTANGFQVSLLSPNAMLGTSGDIPILTIALPVRGDAPVGSQIPVNLDLSNTVFLDGSGQPYPLQVSPGTLTIGGTLSIASVVQGGAAVAAGSTINILGLGFTSAAIVSVDGANVVTTRLVSSQQLDVTLDRILVLDGVRVRVDNGTERVTYYPYLRTAETGNSANPLITAADPLFSRVTYTAASLPWTRGGTAFTGLALQNPGASSTQVTLSLLSTSNQVLQTFSLPLPGKSRITEDLLDFFSQPGASAAAVRISSPQAIQLLGLKGDTAAATLQPVVVSVP